jgi:chitin disaccharide deacetylase
LVVAQHTTAASVLPTWERLLRLGDLELLLMVAKRHLIVNADDFGLSSSVNEGIIKAHEQGIVTSTSLIVCRPGAVEAATYSREHQDLSFGLHVDLGEWAYRDGVWVPLYEVVSMEDIAAVSDQISYQLDTFRRLVGKDPTHIDSHQHVHLREPVRSIVIDVARHLGVPLRHYSSEVRYCGDFYGQTVEGLSFPYGISVDRLMKILAALPPGRTELCCQTGEGVDLDTMYRGERLEEVKVLCDLRVRAAISALEIELCSFNGIVAVS